VSDAGHMCGIAHSWSTHLRPCSESLCQNMARYHREWAMPTHKAMHVPLGIARDMALPPYASQ
jgi:hypothetical protein